LREVWGDDSFFDNVDLLDAGDRVVVQVFHGDARGLPLTNQAVWVYTMRQGLIAGLEWFHSRDEALQALELSK
jgi:ketosteroid isomerase-like protein